MKRQLINLLLIGIGVVLLIAAILMICNIDANAQRTPIYDNGVIVGSVEQTWGGWTEVRDDGGELLLDTYGGAINIYTPLETPSGPSTSEKLLYWYMSNSSTNDDRIIIAPLTSGEKIDMSEFEYHPIEIKHKHYGEDSYFQHMIDSISHQ